MVILLTFVSCSKGNKHSDTVFLNTPAILTNPIDSDSIIPKKSREEIFYDSLKTAIIDTSTLLGKRQRIYNLFTCEIAPSIPEFDTILDLNYDGYQDYVIGYYGLSGTGIKNYIGVYLYNSVKKRYMYDEFLSDLTNPSFFIKKKKITGFYLPEGAGEGIQLEWINNTWTITKQVTVENDETESIWVISYPLKNKTERIKRPYQGIPPSDILESNEDFWSL